MNSINKDNSRVYMLWLKFTLHGIFRSVQGWIYFSVVDIYIFFIASGVKVLMCSYCKKRICLATEALK